MRRAMLDTMVFDALHADRTGRERVLEAVRQGHLLLCTTHVQEDQLAAIPNPVRRKALQRLPRHVVPAAAGVAGVLRTGRARFTEDAAGDALRFGSRHHQDDLIADAAGLHTDVLVTEDRRLIAATRERGMPVWQTVELVAWAADVVTEDLAAESMGHDRHELLEMRARTYRREPGDRQAARRSRSG